MPLPHRFGNKELAVIHSTGSEYDGLFVYVLGTSLDVWPQNGSIYIIQSCKPSQTFENGFSAICMTEACLKVPD